MYVLYRIKKEIGGESSGVVGQKENRDGALGSMVAP